MTFWLVSKSILLFVLAATIFLPLISSNPQGFYYESGLVSCEPNAGATYVDGYLYAGTQPVSGDFVAFAANPNGPAVARIQAGPHPGYQGWNPGFFSHILSATGPRAGSWFFWVENAAGNRISVIAPLTTTASADPGGCQQAHIYFRK